MNKPTIQEDLSELRQQFAKNLPSELGEFAEQPMEQFAQWFTVARQVKQIPEVNAFVLSTANHAGRLRSRTVLLKYFDHNGLVFFTNYGSQKAQDIAENTQVAALFPWYHLELQLIVEGIAEKVSAAESMRYFLSRPRDSQIGAWVSHQSQVIDSRQILLDKVKSLTQSLVNRDIPFPDFWGGYRIRPQRFEFWQGQPNRLHNRIEYYPSNEQDNDQGVEPHWQKRLLAP